MTNNFFWYELLTTDQDAAIDFYTKVVGWTAEDQKVADIDFRYTLLSANGRPVAGLMTLSDEMKAGGMRPGWLGVIYAEDADKAVEDVIAAGGRVLMGPADIPKVGRFALVADPGGALFELMKPEPMEAPPADRMSQGQVGWHELYAADGQESAFAFYSRQCGWETLDMMDMGAMGQYRIFGADGAGMGGMMDKPQQMPAGAWQFYFTVQGIDAAVERIKTNGGQLLMGPMEVPDESWVVQGIDPQGAHFALVSKPR